MKRKITKYKIDILVLSFCLILIMSVGTVVAYMLDKTHDVQNGFNPGQIKIRIDETFENNVKQNVSIHSVEQSDSVPDGSNIDCYIRAAVVINWRNDNGEVFGSSPVAGQDYTIIYNDSNYSSTPALKHWTPGSDGYWYYDYRVPPDGNTDPLIIRCEPNAGGNPPDGYTLNVQIIAQAIQADGTITLGGNSYTVIDDVWDHIVTTTN